VGPGSYSAIYSMRTNMRLCFVCSLTLQLAAETNVLNNTLSLFDLSVSSFPFMSKRIKKILERCKLLEGQLFVDLMLEQAGIISPEWPFPPKDNKAFEMLVEEILMSDWGASESLPLRING
jgi:hypothetical protein